MYLVLRLTSCLSLASSGLTWSANTAIPFLVLSAVMLPGVLRLAQNDSTSAINGSIAGSSVDHPVLLDSPGDSGTSSFVDGSNGVIPKRVSFVADIKGKQPGLYSVDDPLMTGLEGMKRKFWAKGISWIDPHPAPGREGYQQRFNWANGKIIVDAHYYKLTNKQVYFFWYPHWEWCKCEACLKVAWSAYAFCEKRGWDSVYAAKG